MALAQAMVSIAPEASAAYAREDYAGAMSAMAKLRPAVDAFFNKVTVNTEDKALRTNRLLLLNRIREATGTVADFSKIEGKTARPGAWHLRRRVARGNRIARPACGRPVTEVSCACPSRNWPSLFAFINVTLPESRMTITIAHLQPIIALIAGVLILIMPRLLNFIVAIYLIAIGLLGLGLFK